MPLPDERGLQVQEPWFPEVIADLDLSPASRLTRDAAFGRRVSVLIEKVRTADVVTRSRAALRLVWLHEARILNVDEEKAFGDALWLRREVEAGLPGETELLPHVFLSTSAPTDIDLLQIFRRYVAVELGKPNLSEHFLMSLIGSAYRRNDPTKRFDMTTEQALALFDRIVGWRRSDNPFNFNPGDDTIARIVGQLLSDVVLPPLSMDTLKNVRLEKLYALMEAGEVVSAVVAAPQALILDGSQIKRATRLIHRALVGSDTNAVYWAFQAVRRWRDAQRNATLPALPPELVQSTVTIACARRQPGLLHALHLVGEFLMDGVLSEEDKWRLVDALELLHVETAYGNWRPDDTRTITWTLERAAAVVLANKLSESGIAPSSIRIWIDEAKNDPIPEVRHALGAIALGSA